MVDNISQKEAFKKVFTPEVVKKFFIFIIVVIITTIIFTQTIELIANFFSQFGQFYRSVSVLIWYLAFFGFLISYTGRMFRYFFSHLKEIQKEVQGSQTKN